MSDAGYTRIKGADALLPTVEGIHRNRQHFGFHCDHSSIILSKFGTKKGFFQVIHWYDSNAFHFCMHCHCPYDVSQLPVKYPSVLSTA